MKDGKLMNDKRPYNVLSPLSQNRFNLVGGPDLEFVFVRSISGAGMQVTIKDIRRGKHWGTYDAVQNVAPTSDQLAEFTGKYVSDELPGATYTLSIKDGKLLLQVRNGITVFSDRGLALAFRQWSGREGPKDNLLTPSFTDALVTTNGVLMRFMRNQQNAVSGFTLTTGTVRRLRFNKQ